MVFDAIVTTMMLGSLDLVRYLKGFEAGELQVDDFTWSYITRQPQLEDGEQAETVVFLHSFSSSKEYSMFVAGALDRKYKIVIPDLPGQGRTLPADPTLDYSMDQQAIRLHAFITAVLAPGERFHLSGCSMGGMLAGVYAATYPEQIQTLTLMCPAGITMRHKSDTLRLLEETGKNVLLAHTADDLIEMGNYVSRTSPTFPRWIAGLVAMQRRKQMPVLEKIINDSISNPTLLEPYLPHIKAPTQVIWGQNDRVLDVSCVDVMHKMMQGTIKRVRLVPDCGHMVQLEKSGDCAQAINEFLASEMATNSSCLSATAG